MQDGAGAYERIFAKAALALYTQAVVGVVRIGESASFPLILRGDILLRRLSRTRITRCDLLQKKIRKHYWKSVDEIYVKNNMEAHRSKCNILR